MEIGDRPDAGGPGRRGRAVTRAVVLGAGPTRARTWGPHLGATITIEPPTDLPVVAYTEAESDPDNCS